MNIFSKWISKGMADRKSEEKIYQLVHDEIQRGDIKSGLWTEAISKSNGDSAKAKSIYISLRYQSMMDDMILELEKNQSEERASAKAQTGAGHKGCCERCGVKTFINYGNAYHTYCKKCM